MRLKKPNRKRGFSLVELIVVIAIMAVLAGVVGGTMFSQLNKQKDETAKIEQGHLLRGIRNECIELENLGSPEEITLPHMIEMLRDDFPDMVSLTEKGKSAEHKFLIEYDEPAKTFKVSFTTLKAKDNNHTYTAAYKYDTQETTYTYSE